MTEPRLLPNLRFCDYNSRPTVSQSDLKSFGKSVTDYYAEITGEIKSEETEDTIIGNLFHKLVLEGEDALEASLRYVPTKEGKTLVKNGAANLAIWEEFNAAIRKDRLTQDAYPVTPKMVTAAHNMYRGFCQNPKAVELLSLPGETEITGEWPWIRPGGIDSGLIMRGRVDRMIWDYQGQPLIIDLKTTADRSSFESKPDQFRKAVRYMGYDVQGAMYREMMQQCAGTTPRVMLIGFNKTNSFETIVYQLEPSMLDLGLMKLNVFREEYLERVESNYWGTRWDGVQRLEALDWELKAVGIDPNGGGF